MNEWMNEWKKGHNWFVSAIGKKSITFLANDVTKVTSWLMSKAKRTAIYGLFLRLWGRGGDSVRCWVGVGHRDTETLLISGTCPYSLCYGSTTPGLWSVLRSTGTIWRYFAVLLWYAVLYTSGLAGFYSLDVVLRLLSRSKNFHSSKHIRIIHKTDSSIWDPLKCVNSRTCSLFLFSFINFLAELLVFVEEHFDFRPAWRRQLFFAF